MPPGRWIRSTSTRKRIRMSLPFGASSNLWPGKKSLQKAWTIRYCWRIKKNWGMGMFSNRTNPPISCILIQQKCYIPIQGTARRQNKHPPKLLHQSVPDEQPGVHRHKKIGQVQKTPCRFRPGRCKWHQQGLCDIDLDVQLWSHYGGIWDHSYAIMERLEYWRPKLASTLTTSATTIKTYRLLWCWEKWNTLFPVYLTTKDYKRLQNTINYT